MRSCLICALSSMALFLLASPLQADILFSQPVISGGVALASDFARFQQEADNFSLSQFASVQTIQLWGAYPNGATLDFTLRLFRDVAGSPVVTPFVEESISAPATLTNLVDNLGDQIYEYQATLPSSVLLDAGTTYYLSVVDNDLLGLWDWVGSGPGTHWARQDDASTWTASGNATSFAFELLGAPVPEPSTLLLLGIGVLGVTGATRRLVSLEQLTFRHRSSNLQITAGARRKWHRPGAREQLMC